MDVQTFSIDSETAKQKKLNRVLQKKKKNTGKYDNKRYFYLKLIFTASFHSTTQVFQN